MRMVVTRLLLLPAFAVGLSVLPVGCSSAETKVSGPLSAEAEQAIKQEQQQAEEAEMARQQQAK